ncbi:hypothetical protein Tco_0379655 [Tanacetum coccineum]
MLVQNSCRVSEVLEVSCRAGPPSDLNDGSCTRAREVMIFCTIKSKPLALPWGRTPRLDSGVRLFTSFHALFYRRLGKWHTRGVIPVSVGVTIPRISLTKFFISVLKYFRIHISQLSPFGAARISHFEVLTRVLDLGPSVAIFRAFYMRMYSDGLFSFAKRSLSAPSCLSKPPDSIKNWADHFFWVDSRVFPISVPLYTGGVLEKDPAPHLTARQEQAVQVLSSNKAPFRRYPECFLALVGLSPYYPFGENTYPAFEGPDRTDMGLLDYIRTADPRKVQAVEVQKGEEQVTLFDSIKHCFVSLDAPAANNINKRAFRNPTDPECDVTLAEKDVAQRQPEKAKRKKLLKRSDPLPAKRLRIDHPACFWTGGGKSLASLRQSLPESSLSLGASSPADIPTHITVSSSCAADAPVYTTADIVTSSRGKTLDVYVGAARQICLGSEVRSRAEHELELKEKLRGKYDAWGVLLREKDAEIARLKSLLQEKETESAEVPRLRDQVSALAADKSLLSAEVSVLKNVVSQKDTDIALLDSRASYLKSALDDSQAACDEARSLISSLSSERDGLASEVSTLHSAFRDFKEKMEAQQEEAQELYNRVADLEAHVMDVSGRLEGEFYPAYLTALAGRRWLLTYGMELAMVKSVDYGMQEGLAAGHEHGIAGTPLSAVVAYNPETAKNNYFDADYDNPDPADVVPENTTSGLEREGKIDSSAGGDLTFSQLDDEARDAVL